MDELKVKLTIDGASQVSASVSQISFALDRVAAAQSSASRTGAHAALALDKVGAAAAGVGDTSVRAAMASERLSAAIGRVGHYGTMAGAVALASQALGRMVDRADEWAAMAGRLSLVTGSLSAAARAQQQLFGIAQETRVGVASLSEIFVKLSQSTEGSGISQARLMSITKTMGQTLALSGGAAESMKAALVQLGQGMASGTLRGEELNSILEQTPALAKAIADGMGRSVGELRALGAAGKITSEVIVRALEASAKQVESDFTKLPMTVGQAMTQMQNSLLQATGVFDQSNGLSRGLAEGISFLAQNMNVLSAAGTVLVGVMGGRLAAATATSVGAMLSERAASAASLQATVASTQARSIYTGIVLAEARATLASTAGFGASMVAQRAATAASLAHTESLAAQAGAQLALNRAQSVGAVVAGALGGPIGWITTALSLGAAAWQVWGNSSESAAAQARGAVVAAGEDVIAQLKKENDALEKKIALLRASGLKLAELTPAEEDRARLLQRYHQLSSQTGRTEAEEITRRELLRLTTINLAAAIGELDRSARLKAEADKAGGKWEEQLLEIRMKLGGVTAEYTKTLQDLAAAANADPTRAAEYVALMKQVADAHNKTGEAAKRQAEQYQALLKSYADAARGSARKVAEEAAEAESGHKLTDATKAYIALMTDVRDGKVKLADIEREHTKGQGDSTAAILRNAMAQSQALQRAAEGAKVAAELAKAQDSYVAALAKTTAGLDEQIAKEAESYIEMASGKAALDAYTLGKLENARVTALMNEVLESGLDGDAKAAAAYAAQAESLGRLIAMKKLNASTAAAKTGREGVDAFLGADVGAQIADGFDKASQSLSAFVKGFQGLVALDGIYDKQRKAAGITAEQLAGLDAKQRLAQVNAYGTLAGAAKAFFKEGSAGYKTLASAEKAFRAYELAVSIKNAVEKIGLFGTVTAAQVAATATQTAAVAVGQAGETAAVTTGEAARNAAKTPGVFMAFMSALGPWGMAAAGVAIAAVLGSAFSTGANASVPTANTGTGTVLGDSAAKSESIAKAIEALADVDTMTMRYSAQMLDALRGIEANISGLAKLIVRDPKLGSAAVGVDTTIKRDWIGSVLGIQPQFMANLPIIGGFIAKLENSFANLFGKKTSVTGQGITAAPQTLGQIARGNFDASYYADTITKSKFLGITTGSSTGRQQQDASNELERQFTLIFQGFADTVKAAAGPLGVALGTVQQRLDAFVVDIGSINFDGLTGTQISEKLSAVFGAAGDSIAQAVLPGVDAFQQVGEGYLQTVVRVATGVEAAQLALERFGVGAISLADVARKQGDVAAEIVRQSIVAAETTGRMTNLMGPHLAPLVSNIGSIMATLDGSAAELASTYAALLGVRGALLSVGASGADLSVAMIRGAGGLDALASSLSDYLDGFFSEQERTAAGMARLGDELARIGINTVPQTREAFRALVEGINTSTDAGAREYAQLISLAGAFASLVPATTAAASAARSASDIAGERAGLEQQLLQAQGDSAALRALERAKLDDSNRALFDQIAALQDLKVATEAAATAAQAAAQVQAAIASQRSGLETQLLQLQGNTAELRRREIEALDPSNRSLQQRIYDLQDAQAADSAAAQAAKDAADQAAALRDAWRSVGATIADEVRRILGLVGGQGQSLSSVRAQFALATAQARAGDKDAAANLPELSRTMLDLATATASSAQEMALIRASTAASLAQTLRLLEWRGADPLPAFASGGRHAGGLRLVGERGPEIEATGPSRIWSAPQTASMLGGGTARLEVLVEALAAEVEGLRAEMQGLRHEARATAGHTGKTARILDRVSQAGDSFATTVAA